MDRSQRLYEELKEIKFEIERAKNHRIEMIEDPEVQSTVLSMIVAQNIFGPNDPALLKLQGEVSEIKKRLYAQEEQLTAKMKATSRELRNLTASAITKGIEQFNRELIGLKIEKRKIGRTSGGISMTPKVIIETNVDGIAKIQTIVRRGIEMLKEMAEKPISEIEAFVEERLNEIRKVDLRAVEKELDEVEDMRNDFLSSR